MITDEGRRPEHPHFDPTHPSIADRKRPVLLFKLDDRPPFMVHHWLLKSARPHETFEYPKQAVDWLVEEWSTVGAEAADHVSLPTRGASAREQLEQGNDVAWQVWFPSGAVICRAAVPCPTRGVHGPVVPCPISWHRG
ncbi:hypothetical protein [Kitasatospora sp. NPDC097643]|uniref:hypothetical protein n=1 Tax=Kitasatospora sp. NPDC097643 TaxID=3157230 RepID=UPI003333869A